MGLRNCRFQFSKNLSITSQLNIVTTRILDVARDREQQREKVLGGLVGDIGKCAAVQLIKSPHKRLAME